MNKKTLLLFSLVLLTLITVDIFQINTGHTTSSNSGISYWVFDGHEPIPALMMDFDIAITAEKLSRPADLCDISNTVKKHFYLESTDKPMLSRGFECQRPAYRCPAESLLETITVRGGSVLKLDINETFYTCV